MYCNQVGKVLSVDAETLSCEDGQISTENIVKGANLFYQEGAHSYAVTVVEVLAPKKTTKRKIDEKEDTLMTAKDEVS